MPEQSLPTGAVFLSYASEDAEAAARICEALRAAGVEVWFDRSELRGGDAWDAKIKKQIHDCALFLPIISAHTNARTEGYFRREWKLATRRLLDIADDAAFLVPVVIDKTQDADARVPEEFMHVQWTLLPDGETPTEFAQRVRQLLGLDRAAEPAAHSAVKRTLEASGRSSGSVRPSGTPLVRRFAIPVIVLLLVLGGGLVWYYHGASDVPAAKLTPSAALPAVADARPSIAVLPFENRSRLEDDVFFVDGVHDDILAQLSKVSALRVISRTSVVQFRDTKLPLKAIADQLGVTKILEGGVQRAGDRVRVSVQLIEAATDAHLWAENYDRELSAANIFAIQSEIAAAIADALKTSLSAGELAQVNAIPTESLEAWQDYQLGKQRMAARTSAALAEAEAHFRKAVVLDPKFALAWVGMADALALQTKYANRPRESALTDAERAVTRALELDPELAQAWASAGNIANQRLQLDDAERKLRRAIALNPNLATAPHWLSVTLMDVGRRDEALAMAERAVVLDPLSAVINAQLGAARVGVGQFDDALVAFTQAITIDPTMASAYFSIGEVLGYGFGRLDSALAWYEKATSMDPGNPEILGTLVQVYWELGDGAEAGRLLERRQALGEADAYSNYLASILDLERGDAKSARKHAQTAAEQQPGSMYLIRDHDLRSGDYATARSRYAKAFPQLFGETLPTFNRFDASAAIDLALVLQHTGEGERASELLNRSEAYIRKLPRMGIPGFGISDVAIHALRGDKAMALTKLRVAEQAGWVNSWRYTRDFDPNLASIRNEPEFKAVFADIEREMARQRARLAARPKDASLELTEASR